MTGAREPPPRGPESRASRPARPAEEPPPILGTWPRLYVLVVVDLLLMIALCHWLTQRR